jgi:hypothetical protein
MKASSNRRSFLILALLFTVAFVATVATFRPHREPTSVAETRKPVATSASVTPAQDRPAEQSVRPRMNPAVQKAGPPNLKAEESAASSAQSAAEAAARLAASAER